MNRSLAGLALLTLAGCSLGPDYKAPTLDIPAAYRATPQTAAQAWPSRAWWKGFNSPELDTLIATAQTDNFDIIAAIARVRQADAAMRVAGAPLLPTVSADGKYDWQHSFVSARRTSGANAGRTVGAYVETRTYTFGPSISYELDFWGALRAQRDSAAASALATRFDQQTVALTVVTSVASTWFQALALQDRVDVARRNLHDAEQILGAIRARLDAGTASLLDVSQQEALVAGVRAQIPGLQSQLEQEVNALGILIGKPPSFITVRPGTLTALALPPTAPGVPSQLLARRPDVAFAEAQLIAANADIRVARANFYPQVALSASGGWQNIGIQTLFGPGSLFASAAASAVQTLFDNGRLSAQFDQAQGRYDELVAGYRKTVVQAFTDVDNAITAFNYATEQEVLEQQAVAVAQRAADIARAQLLAGTSDIVTALQAQSTLFSDLDTLAQVRLQRFSALLSLYKALGGGWSNADIEAPTPTLFQGVL